MMSNFNVQYGSHSQGVRFGKSGISLPKPNVLVKNLERNGFVNCGGEGSHTVYKHPDGRRTLLAIHGTRDVVDIRTLNGISKQTQLPVSELNRKK